MTKFLFPLVNTVFVIVTFNSINYILSIDMGLDCREACDQECRINASRVSHYAAQLGRKAKKIEYIDFRFRG